MTKNGNISSAQTLSGSKTVAMATAQECHFTPCLMYTTSAKFEEHCSNISKDILHFVICLPLEPLMTSPVFKEKLEYLRNERQYFKNESTILFLF